MLTVGSLFAGVGGLDLGLERAGMTVRWQIENDAYCQRVLAKHWPDVKRYGDVRECGDELETVDLICGGFPCQPVSCAGQRKGKADDRWLWPEFRRIVRVLRPRWVLAENVPGLLSVDRGQLFGGILRDLAESGYDAEWDCIPAAAVGAPHLRYRVFVVANADRASWRRSAWAGRWSGGEKSLAETCQRNRGKANGIWTTEPDVDRVADGVPNRSHRLRGLGNAVVPAVAEWIGQRIVETETKR